ncbi:LysM peptidoglycan-binding domain-containing M23 family metallopeptidase [Streptomyces sp. H10-C2]|uniref:M23 family metallopeptidase n=1 Tax=unclassified Streptomyces TaxID=2593676 RepID=UPI0024B98E13|nr:MULTISPECIES: LysM peptidoglycan-binding domain-containing M23 family metallopeptidase [unclassified Streptomyces]MDJ0345569.1 LysM peptidoglycan-binding domain-containing M23 family metallopeptidase [Streptomyces sp. PH10-H1]MDJ0371418.1 LysM peptidoglycan-binding domain-containing M23 family metallopeptidase [Streptomyces sp. H10-C2]
MPAQGKHRLRSMNRLTRICVAAGTGGVALALPLTMAANASAADTHAAAANVAGIAATNASSHTAAPAAPVAKAAPAKSSADESYKVVGGDSLSKIADVHRVSGGWQTLYANNKKTVGGNPDLIYPGQTLALGGKAAAASSAPKSSAPKSSAPKSSAPKSSAPKSSAPAEKALAKSGTSASSSAAKAPAKSASSAPSASTSSSSGYNLPVTGPIGTPYHQAGSNWSSGYHTGVDFVVSTGTSVKAIANGTVVSAGWDGAYGNEVVIQHGDGKYSQYAHLSQLSVSAGQTVSAGSQLGLSGATGNVTGPHLHFEIRTGPGYGTDIDPLGYLRAHGVSV